MRHETLNNIIIFIYGIVVAFATERKKEIILSNLCQTSFMLFFLPIFFDKKKMSYKLKSHDLFRKRTKKPAVYERDINVDIGHS